MYLRMYIFSGVTGAVTIARGATETGATETGATEIGTGWSVCAPSGGVEL
jgi:hypothetical protein